MQQFKKVIFEKFDKNNDSKIELLEVKLIRF